MSPLTTVFQVTPVGLSAVSGTRVLNAPSVPAAPVATTINASVSASLPISSGLLAMVPVGAGLPVVPSSGGAVSTSYVQALDSVGTSIVNFFLTALELLAPVSALPLPAVRLRKRVPQALPVAAVANIQGAASAATGIAQVVSPTTNGALGGVGPPNVSGLAGGLLVTPPIAPGSAIGQVTGGASGITGAAQGASGAMTGLSTLDPLIGIGLSLLAIMCHTLGIDPATALGGVSSQVKRSAAIEDLASRQLLAAGRLPVAGPGGITNVLGSSLASLSSTVSSATSRFNSATSTARTVTGLKEGLPVGGSGSPVPGATSALNGAIQNLPLGSAEGAATPVSGVTQAVSNTGITTSNTAAGPTAPLAIAPGVGSVVGAVGSSLNGLTPNAGNLPAVVDGVANGNLGAVPGSVAGAVSGLAVNAGNLGTSTGTVGSLLSGFPSGNLAGAVGSAVSGAAPNLLVSPGAVSGTAPNLPNFPAGGLPSNLPDMSSSGGLTNGLTSSLPVAGDPSNTAATVGALTSNHPILGIPIAPNSLLPILSSLLANLPASGLPLGSLGSIEQSVSSAVDSLTAELPGAQLIVPVISLLKILAAINPSKYGGLANLDSINSIQQAVQNLTAQPLQLSFVQGLPLPTGNGSIFGLLLSLLDSVDQLTNNGIDVQSGLGLILSKTFGFAI